MSRQFGGAIVYLKDNRIPDTSVANGNIIDYSNGGTLFTTAIWTYPPNLAETGYCEESKKVGGVCPGTIPFNNPTQGGYLADGFAGNPNPSTVTISNNRILTSYRAVNYNYDYDNKPLTSTNLNEWQTDMWGDVDISFHPTLSNVIVIDTTITYCKDLNSNCVNKNILTQDNQLSAFFGAGEENPYPAYKGPYTRSVYMSSAGMVYGQTGPLPISENWVGLVQKNNTYGVGMSVENYKPIVDDDNLFGYQIGSWPSMTALEPELNQFQTYKLTRVVGGDIVRYEFQPGGWYKFRTYVATGEISQVRSLLLQAQGFTNGNAAQFVSQSVPTTVIAGQVFSVSVTMKNTGTTNWIPTTTNNYRLGSQLNTGVGDDFDAQSYTPKWIVKNNIPPGGSETFTFNITAPTTLGTYKFGRQMVQELIQWFGAYTPVVNINVVTADITPPDTTPPVISNISATNIGQLTADINWTTNEPTDGQVEFLAGPCPGVSNCFTPIETRVLLTSHTINISGLTADTSYTYRVKSKDASGNLTISPSQTFRTLLGKDTTAPTVSLTSPANGATVSGTSVTVSATASDNIGIAGVQFKLDGVNYGGEDTTAPYSVNFNSTTVSNGSHALTAVARDTAGNIKTSSSVAVTVFSNTLPIGTFDGLKADGVTLYGWSYDSNSSTVSNPVQIFINGPIGTGTLISSATTNILRTDINLSFNITGNHGFEVLVPAQYRDSLAHSYYVYGIDINDSTKSILLTGSPKTFIVASPTDTTPPTVPANLTATAVSSSQINLTWAASTDNVGVAGYKIFRNGTQVNTSTTRSYSDTNLTSSTAYTYRVVAYDVAGNSSAQSSQITATTLTVADTTLPTVSLTSPANGATVSGTSVTVSATASDNIGIAGVQFKLDGVNYGGEDTTAPYSVNFNSTTVSNGSHALTAVARDTAGNIVASSNVSITVNNVSIQPSDTTAPSIPTSLTATSVSSNQINLTWTASTDNVGVTGYRIFRNGIQIATAIVATNYSDTGLMASIAYTYTVLSYDLANNNSAQSSPISVVTPVVVIQPPSTPPNPSPVVIPAPLPIPTPLPSNISPTISLTRTIYLGSRGTDVTSLQNILIQLGYLSSGNNTGYFGALTRSAIQRYQCDKMQLCSGDEKTTGYGLVGTRTRTLLSGGIVTPTPTSVPPPSPTSSINQSTGYLPRTIYLGSRGTDVTSLQNILIQLGYLSSGNNTGYFGALTRSAIQRYQCDKMQLCSGDEKTTGYGLVGVKTRAMLLTK